jgi:hypothetical protein
MEKPIPQEKYLFGNDIVSIDSSFIYEVSLYKITKNGANVIDSKLYKSDKPLSIDSCTTKKYGNYTLARFVYPISITEKFKAENNIKKYERPHRNSRKLSH